MDRWWVGGLPPAVGERGTGLVATACRARAPLGRLVAAANRASVWHRQSQPHGQSLSSLTDQPDQPLHRHRPTAAGVHHPRRHHRPRGRPLAKSYALGPCGFLPWPALPAKYLAVLWGVASAVRLLLFHHRRQWGALAAILVGATSAVAVNIAWNHHHG